MESEHYEMMISHLRTNTMDKLFSLMTKAEKASIIGDVAETRKITLEAIKSVEIVSDALIAIICDAYGGEKADIERDRNNVLKEQVKHTFTMHIVMAMHIRSALEKGIPEA